MSTLFERFVNDSESRKEHSLLVMATRLPSGAIETQTNTTHLDKKVAYIKEAYNEDFALKTNTNIQVMGYILL